MSTPPSHKRPKLSPSGNSPRTATESSPTQLPNPPISTTTEVDVLPPPPPNPRKRPRSPASPLPTSKPLNTLPPPARPLGSATSGPSVSTPAREEVGKKKPRTNTPWTPEEEQLLKRMRDEKMGWGEIAKSFPNRTEGSVKKHWYKDMHYAEWTEPEVAALKEAARDYDANKWKIIGQQVGKPPKACEQYFKDHPREM